MFERLARRTGGACFNLREMRKEGGGDIGARIFDAARDLFDQEGVQGISMRRIAAKAPFVARDQN